MRIIEDQTFDVERALYGIDGVRMKNCSFGGPADGESACKEGRDIEAEHCFPNLCYPFWRDRRLKIADKGRAAAKCAAAPERIPVDIKRRNKETVDG